MDEINKQKMLMPLVLRFGIHLRELGKMGQARLFMLFNHRSLSESANICYTGIPFRYEVLWKTF
jgi:hypothetical protein